MVFDRVRNLRSALRSARRHPVFSGGVVLTLGLALGANTAIFGVVRGVLLRQLPFDEPDRLYVVHLRESGVDQPFSIADFFDLRADAGSFETLVAWGSWNANLTGVEEPVRLPAQWTGAGFFDALGIRPALGRAPLPEEERGGSPRVVLLSDRVWRAQWGADPAVLGRVVSLNGEPFTVIGVLAPVHSSILARGAELVSPLALEADPRRGNRGGGFLRVVGRLRADTSAATATAELDGIVAGLRAAFPDTNANKEGVRLEPLAERIVGGHRRTLVALQLAVGGVLLVACTNLASLLLARIVGRRPELALRAALGAGRGDVLRQLLGEILVLAAAGGAFGVGVAWALLRGLALFGSANLPRADEVALDGPVVGFAVVAALLTGLLTGLLPALHGSSAALSDALRGSGRGTTGGAWGARIRAALVLVEVAMAVVLLAVAGLLLRSFARLSSTDPGFAPEGVLSVQLSLPRGRYADPASISRYGEELTRRLAELPGVASAGVASVSPLAPWRASVSMTIEGRAEPTRENAPIVNYRAVAPGYFDALGIPLLAGRDVDSRDRADGASVALVSSTLARRHFPGGSPIGARLGIDDGGVWRTVEVIGVTGDVKHTGLDAEDTADVYVPYPQTPPAVSVWLANLMCLVVRSDGDPQTLVPAVRREVRALDPDVAGSFRTMEEAVAASLADRRLTMRLLSGFAGVGLLLALAGVWAVTAIGVAERQHEIAVRLSLGAGRRQILATVVGRALAPVALGLAVGLAATLALGRLVESLLFGVAAHDPGTLVAVGAALAATALLASLLPARRATRIDPVGILRGA